MFFNLPVIIETKKSRVSPQIDFRLPNFHFSPGNNFYFPTVELPQPPIAVKPPPSYRQPPPKTEWEIAADILCAIGLSVVIGGALVLTAAAVAELLRPRNNNAQLTAGTRRFIRERDGEICFYCGELCA